LKTRYDVPFDANFIPIAKYPSHIPTVIQEPSQRLHGKQKRKDALLIWFQNGFIAMLHMSTPTGLDVEFISDAGN